MRMISTLPRSGTWYTKYLLAVLYRLSAGQRLDIEDVFGHVKNLAAADAYIDQAQVLRHHVAGLVGTLPHVVVSHFICPGFLSMDDRVAQSARDVLQSIGALDYHLREEAKTRDFSPGNGARVCFIYRNPFSVFGSYARRFKDRAEISVKKPIPFNAHWPIAAEFQNEPFTDPLAHYIANFRRSNFTQAYVVMVASYRHMANLFPGSIMIQRYEDIHNDEWAAIWRILGFLGFPMSERSFLPMLDQALAFVQKDKMIGYEAKLAHALSGNSTYYGEEEKNHITKTPERYDLISPDDVLWARGVAAAFYPGLETLFDQRREPAPEI